MDPGSKGTGMAVWVVVSLLIALDVAAALWGHDSRDGRDWR